MSLACWSLQQHHPHLSCYLYSSAVTVTLKTYQILPLMKSGPWLALWLSPLPLSSLFTTLQAHWLLCCFLNTKLAPIPSPLSLIFSLPRMLFLSNNYIAFFPQLQRHFLTETTQGNSNQNSSPNLSLTFQPCISFSMMLLLDMALSIHLYIGIINNTKLIIT